MPKYRNSDPSDKTWRHWRKWEDSDRGMRDQSFERFGRDRNRDGSDDFASSDYNRNFKFDPGVPARERPQRQMDHGDYQYEGMIQHPSGWSSSFTPHWDETTAQSERRLLQRSSHYGKGPKGYRRSDARILEEVSEALTQDPDVDASDIEVQVENGIVTLRGSVENRMMKRRAEECIEECPGVDDVRNALTVKQVNYGDYRKDEPPLTDRLQ